MNAPMYHMWSSSTQETRDVRQSRQANDSASIVKRAKERKSALVHRALMICTKHRLNGEIEQIKKILLDNGYPKNVIKAQIAEKIVQFFTLKRFQKNVLCT